jgi:hypothetical protein
MAYNLPPSWDPKFALPKNVRDEGLERRGFVTKQMPRGTYDNTTTGTGGFVVPQYIKDEGTGQGAYTTRWMPRGTYAGDRIPHWLNQRPQLVSAKRLPNGARQVQIQTLQPAPAMSGTDPTGDPLLPQPFEDYGARAADILIRKVAQLSPRDREAMLKKILDTVDKSAWGRTMDIWARYKRQGMDPTAAFRAALARALSSGFAAEIVNTGLKSVAPQANSLLGLGCYGGRAALGADDGTTAPAAPSTPATGPYPTQPPPGPDYGWVVDATGKAMWAKSVPPGGREVQLCNPPTGFTWQVDHWARLSAGTVAVPGPCRTGSGGIRSHTDPSGSPGMAIAVDPTQRFSVGPLSYPVTFNRVLPATTFRKEDKPDHVFYSPDQLSADLLSWIRTAITGVKDGKPDADGQHDTMITKPYNPDVAPDEPTAWNNPDAPKWFSALNIDDNTPLRLHLLWGFKTGINPLLRTKNPVNGDDLLMFVMLTPLYYANKKPDGTRVDPSQNPLVIKVWLGKRPDPNWMASIWNFLAEVLAVIGSTVGQFVVDAAEALADLACDVLSNPTITGAAAGVGGSMVGIPPQAGAAAGAKGADIAKAVCGGSPPPAPVAAPPTNWLMIALLGGGALLATTMIMGSTKKQRKKKP